MAYTLSNMLELGTVAPDFSLPNVLDGEKVNLKDVHGEHGTVVMFICNHCPYVIYVLPEIVQLAREYQASGISFIAISPTDIAQKPADAPDKMKELADKHDFPFPYLYDETQEVARAYDAACTPDFYVFDTEEKLYYRGQLDSARPGNTEEINGKDLRNALDKLLAGKPSPSRQYPSGGCGIKWKKG